MVTIKNIEVLSEVKYPLKKITFDRKHKNGDWQTEEREVYDRGNAATVLLYSVKKRTVLLTRQFRLPTYLNGNPDGLLLETCAGMLDHDNPEDCARRESEEETGYEVGNLKYLFEAYMSAGSLTEKIYFFTGTYSEDSKISEGGGLKEEQEDIEVIELNFEEATAMIRTGEIRDAKTIILLQYAQINKIFESLKTLSDEPFA